MKRVCTLGDTRPESHPQPLEEQVRSSLVHQLYCQGPVGFIGAIFGALIVIISLWNLIPRSYLIMWFAAYAVVQLFRYKLVQSYAMDRSEKLGPRVWERRFAWGNFAAGCLWGMAALVLFPETSVVHQYMLALFIAGISCGAAAFYWPSAMACLPTIVVELLPLSGRFFHQADETGIVTGVVVLVFCVVVLLMARHLRSFGMASLRLRLEKDALLCSLRQSGEELERRVEERTRELSSVNETLRHEIDERLAAEESNRKSEEKYRLVVDHAQEAIFVAQDGFLRFVNPQTVDILAYSEEELLSDPFTTFIHPEDREMVLQNHLRRLRGEDLPRRYGFRVVHRAGVVKWVEICSVMIQWEGRPAALVFMTDVTDRREAEEALGLSEERYRNFFDTCRDAVFMTSVDGSFVDLSDSALEMLGYAPSERPLLMQESVGSLYVHGAERDEHVRVVSQLGFSKEYPVQLKKKDGTVMDTLITTVARKDAHGAIVGFQGTVRDVTDRKRSEAALRESEHRFRALLEDVASVPVQGYDEERKVVFWNSASERLYGYSKEEAVGNRLEDLIIPPHMRAGVVDAVNNWIETGERIPPGELGLMRKDGSIVSVYSSHVMLEHPQRGKEMYCVDLDLTDLKKAEEERIALQSQLSEAQKMEAIGTLASGIAHDFNNLLQVTLGYSELLLDGKTEKDSDYEELQRIYSAARSGAELVQNLLTFCRKVEPQLVTLSLNQQIVHVEKLLFRTIPKMIDIRLEMARDLQPVSADPTRIEQVLMNLAVNARDAMPEGGTLTVLTRNVVFDGEYCKRYPNAKPGPYVMLAVTDTGKGMEPEVLDHIFEPFFTTKELGRGTGLGLAMVYGIVKQHGGQIGCISEVGLGTRFELYFPAIAPDQEPAGDASAVMPAFGTETVLLVDDESAVRELGERILRKGGYTVLTAANGHEALDTYANERDRIALVILDLIMPGMGGKDCLRGLRSLDPSVRVLVASGLGSDGVAKECRDLGAGGFVAKPFRLKELLIHVRKILDES
jgi:two-component system, cell cycle sensor histidine kinase and response regulator CckA